MSSPTGLDDVVLNWLGLESSNGLCIFLNK